MQGISVPIHVIDFEGTRSSGVVEYGVVTLHNNEITKTYSRLCEPSGEISFLESRQHGITASLVGDSPTFSEEWGLFSSLRGTGILAGHHAQTENMLLKSVWPYPRVSPNFVEPGGVVTSWGPWVDTCWLYRNIYPGLKSYKLMDLIEGFQLQINLDRWVEEYCQVGRDRHHCALHDALGSALLLKYILELPEFRDKVGLQWLLVNSASSRKRMGLEQRVF